MVPLPSMAREKGIPTAEPSRMNRIYFLPGIIAGLVK